jgi:phage-related protein
MNYNIYVLGYLHVEDTYPSSTNKHECYSTCLKLPKSKTDIFNKSFKYMYTGQFKINCPQQRPMQLAKMSPWHIIFSRDSPKFSNVQFLQWWDLPQFSEMSSGLLKLNCFKYPYPQNIHPSSSIPLNLNSESIQCNGFKIKFILYLKNELYFETIAACTAI